MNLLTTVNDAATHIAFANNALSATDDLQAISAWLSARATRSKNTFDAYHREAQRLLVWLAHNNLKLQDLKIQNAHDYLQMLANPPEEWIRPRSVDAGHQLSPTQLFYKALSASSIARVRVIIISMLEYLQDAGYIERNVVRLTMSPPVIKKSVVTRNLDLMSWNYLCSWILKMPKNNSYELRCAARARWLFSLMYHTGIRREEVSSVLMGDLVRNDNNWELRVIGKGSKERFVTLNSAVLAELKLYRQANSMSELPVPGEVVPLVMSVCKNKKNKGLKPRAINTIISDISKSAAKDCTDLHIKSRLEKTSPHWIRHTSATHRLLAGSSLETVQDELGHQDPKTTRIYAKTNYSKRREDAELLAKLNQLN